VLSNRCPDTDCNWDNKQYGTEKTRRNKEHKGSKKGKENRINEMKDDNKEVENDGFLKRNRRRKQNLWAYS
jgi:hypothetical protein